MKKIIATFFMLLALFVASQAHAVVGEWQTTEQASARLIAGRGPDDHALFGLQLKLQPGWHAYWRSPGDAGLAPQLDWAQSENLGSQKMLFPIPEKETLQGLVSYAYADEVVLPLHIERNDPAQPLKLRAKTSVLVCKDICIPASFTLALDVPTDAVTDDETDALLAHYAALVPIEDDGQEDYSLESARYGGSEGKAFIDIQLGGAALATKPPAKPEIIVELGDGGTLPINATTLQAGSLHVELGADAPKASALIGKKLTFTLVDRATNYAIEKALVIEGAPAGADAHVSTMPAHVQGPSLILMIFFALLGGLILNLMPCVLPVLALKSLSFVSHGGGTNKGVRLSFLVTTAGILTSFLIMALVLIELKSLGMSVGWGVQFQHPIFLVGLITVLLLFAANLWGLFEIPLPRFLADRLVWTQGHGNLVKDFFSGAFATLLATPCTAPFLGTAVGFALMGGPVEILCIFMALGFGLALPFLLIALFPVLATKLPKPGNWMNHLKRVLSLALVLTALWFGYVLAVQLHATTNTDAEWQAFDRPKIAEYVEKGRVVYVDVTAEWCLTCKYNKRTVLDTPEMKAIFKEHDVVMMRADWTQPSNTIAVFLKDYGRYGIPFNIIYGPAAPQGIAMPELLSKKAVEEGLLQAKP